MSAIPYHSLNKETKKQLVDLTVAIVGDKWSLHVLGNLAFEESPLRFNQLMEKLRPISSRTLSSKLAKLVEHGIVKKEIENASPPYNKYSLTEKGVDLVKALDAMAEWSMKWYGQPKPNPLRNIVGFADDDTFYKSINAKFPPK